MCNPLSYPKYRIVVTYKESEKDMYIDAKNHSSPAAYLKDCQKHYLETFKMRKILEEIAKDNKA